MPPPRGDRRFGRDRRCGTTAGAGGGSDGRDDDDDVAVVVVVVVAVNDDAPGDGEIPRTGAERDEQPHPRFESTLHVPQSNAVQR